MNLGNLNRLVETISPNQRISSANIFKGATTATSIAATLSILASFTSTGTFAISDGLSASKPWIVQTIEMEGVRPTASCSGTAITRNAILTAEHCGQPYEVYYPNGKTVRVSSYTPLPGDLKLLFLAEDNVLSEYPTFGPNYFALGGPIPKGSIGELYGFGSHYHSTPKRLKMSVEMHGVAGDDDHEAIYTLPMNGSPDKGDSGGPLMIGGHLVGVFQGTIRLSEGSQFNLFHGTSQLIKEIKNALRTVDHAREMRSADEKGTVLPWISQVKVESGAVAITMGSELINAGRKIVVWVNGRYLGEVNSEDSYYYATKEVIRGGAIFRMGGFTVLDTDLIQIGIVNGANDPRYSELLYQNTLRTVHNDKVEGPPFSPSPTGSYVSAISISAVPGQTGQSTTIVGDNIYLVDDSVIYLDALPGFDGQNATIVSGGDIIFAEPKR